MRGSAGEMKQRAKQLLTACGGLLMAFAHFPIFSSSVEAAAPQRSGQSYAESICDTDSNVIFCEDFNYPQNLTYTSQFSIDYSNWINPGFVGGSSRNQVYGFGRQINPATNYGKPNLFPGSAQNDYVWVANWDSTKGATGNANSNGKIRNPGGNYMNGLPPATDFYVRYQVYFTPDYAWPGDPKTDKYNWGSSNPVDSKQFFVYPPEGLDQPTNASYDAGVYTNGGTWDPATNARFADALAFRVGTSSDNYKQFPLCAVCGSHNQHNEYGPYQHPDRMRNPSDSLNFGQIWRFDTGRWYTLEFRYKLSNPSGALNGTIEAWIDGIKIYSASDLETCTNSQPYGDCSGLGAFILVNYHNSQDSTVWKGQMVVDNLIISRAYIGVPNSASSSVVIQPPATPTPITQAPAAPTALTVQ
jgi:hypothetical protein